MNIDEKHHEASAEEKLLFGNGFAVQNYLERELEDAKRRKTAALVKVIVIIIVAALIVNCLVVCPKIFRVFRISSESMEPTLMYGDVVLVHETAKIGAGDVVCYSSFGKTIMCHAVALGGSVVAVGEGGAVTVDGALLPEAYGDILKGLQLPVAVPEGSVLVLDDNDLYGLENGNAFIGSDCIVGKVVFRIWPIGRLGCV